MMQTSRVGALSALFVFSAAGIANAQSLEPQIKVPVPANVTWDASDPRNDVVDAKWGGVKGGLQGGYSAGDVTRSPQGTTPGAASGDIDGAVFGLNLGVDVQQSDLIFGLQWDGEWSRTQSGIYQSAAGGSVIDSTEGRFQTSLRARAGYLVNSRVMVYGNAGLAASTVAHEIVDGTDSYQLPREFQAGWTAGVGMEFLYTPRAAAFLEYRHTDFGERDVDAVQSSTSANTLAAQKIEKSANQVRVGMRLNFNDSNGFQFRKK